MTEIPHPKQLETIEQVMNTLKVPEQLSRLAALQIELLKRHFALNMQDARLESSSDHPQFLFSRKANSMPESMLYRDIDMQISCDTQTDTVFLWMGILPCNTPKDSRSAGPVPFDNILTTIDGWLEEFLDSALYSHEKLSLPPSNHINS